MRAVLESIRQSFPVSAEEVSPFVRGMAAMFWIFIISLIVFTILGMRANGQI